MAALCGLLLNFSQFVLPVGIAMGGDLSRAQSNQSPDAYPEIETAPPSGSCDRTPSRYPTHGTIPELLFVAGIAYLLGFKILARLSRLQLERMKEIWGK